MKKIFLLFFIIGLSSTSSLLGASLNLSDTLITIKGRVSDSIDNPLSGASITIVGSKVGVLTDVSGNYILKNIKIPTTINITYAGYKSKTVSIATNILTLNISLSQNNASLDEAQVLSYSNSSKRFNISTIASISSVDIQSQPVGDITLALQGRVPGASIVQGTGIPGGATWVRLRGKTSLQNYNNDDVLFLVDGTPYPTQGPLTFGAFNLGGTVNIDGSPFVYINPQDIESIEVLKDAVSTSVYGSRGSNGVILVTTKRSKASPLTIDLNYQTGFGKVPKFLKLLNRRQYLDMRYEAFKNDNLTPDPNNDFDLTFWDTTRNTDWQKTLIGNTAQYTNAQLTASGGNALIQYLVSGNYYKQGTVFPGSEYEQKSSTHFNISLVPSKKIKINWGGFYLVESNHRRWDDNTEAAISLPPDAPALFNPDGSINWAINSNNISTWPFERPDVGLNDNVISKTKNLMNNLTASYDFTKNLQLRINSGYNKMSFYEILMVPKSSIDPPNRDLWVPYAQYSNISHKTWIIEPQLNYTKNFNKLSINSYIGGTFTQTKRDYKGQEGDGYPDEQSMYNPSAANKLESWSSSIYYNYNALRSKINGIFNSKYIIDLSYVRDGSVNFQMPIKNYHNYYSYGIGWIFSEEKIIKSNFSFLSFGKVRGSYGTTGGDKVGDNEFFRGFTSSALPINNTYQGGVAYPPLYPGVPYIAPEITAKREIGIELGFLKDKIMLSVIHYRNRSYNQFIPYNVGYLPGFDPIRENRNLGIQNSGYEFQLKTTIFSNKNINWSSEFNVWTNNSKYYSPNSGKVLRNMYIQNVFKYAGADPFTGQAQFLNHNGEDVLIPDSNTDKYPIDWTKGTYAGSIISTFTYKRLSVIALIIFSHNKTYSYFYNKTVGAFDINGGYFGYNQPIEVMNRWQKVGDVAFYRKFTTQWDSRTKDLLDNSDISIRDGSYVKLKNLSISYQILNKWKKSIKNARVYVQGQNLFTITKYTGFDPEGDYPTVLPPLRVITMGFQITL